MANFYFEKYVNNYEIDFYNNSTVEEKSYLKSKGIKLGIYYKTGEKWNQRISGLTFNLSSADCYPALKEYLDYRFNQFMRKMKLEKIKTVDRT